ncbi:phosphoinositide 4-kinase gamma 1 [Perilla frutescens var. hirtella]|uniref:1-phosphatidylinositol 4-kinase n=1 Tax=Perilla frutescens var. hirtella TaxID=608512 RepID=A0AAD4IPN8_PERFH|nr:phosphoinositide 4-kinase gamma 1 [Perilla frutescens var. hirtella]
MAAAVNQVHGFKPLACPPRYHPQSVVHLDYKMLDFSQSVVTQSLEHAFNFACIHKSSSTPCLSYSSKPEDDLSTNPRIEIIAGHSLPQVHALVVEVAIAMAAGVNIEPAASGLGGAYFLHARNGHTIAVAKPIDEEPLALNNPKGFGGRMLGQPGMKSSIRIGETGARESAAYLLDHGGFSGVPPTALVKLSHFNFNLIKSDSDSNPSYKIASLQRFVNHDSDAGDLGPSSFSATSVHHIGILDVRLMNLDRHAGNLLVRQENESYGLGKAELVPIDHGFCLPECLDNPYFEWQHWPQASLPFSEAEVDYISSLDPFKDAELLRTEVPSIRESSIRVLVICTIFLKQATAYGLCLVDIGEMMTRKFIGGKEHWSSLESLCATAKASLNMGLSDDSASSDQEADEMLVVPRVFKKRHAKGVLMRSLSSPTPYNPSSQSISFGDMDDEEWQSFLKIFQEFLPEAFEERESMGLSKQRLRTSCAF